ncbi:MAG: (p)ppGpp synthetase [Acholeplasmatales bacterium]|nr:(p)ppGpp synthetase [Acholeplasmatales bacterium]
MINNLTRVISFDKIDNSDLLDEKSKEMIKAFLKIERNYRYALNKMNTKIENMDDFCRMTYAHNPIHHTEARLKSPDSIIEKMKRRGYDISFESLKENLLDIAGMRVVCNYINDIYQIVHLLSLQKDIRVKVTKDYIVNPKPTGYRSLHIVFEIQLCLADGEIWVPVEIQFRSLAMDMWASLEHELRYKASDMVSKEEKELLRKYSDSLYEIDLGMQRIYIDKTAGGGRRDD